MLSVRSMPSGLGLLFRIRVPPVSFRLSEGGGVKGDHMMCCLRSGVKGAHTSHDVLGATAYEC